MKTNKFKRAAALTVLFFIALAGCKKEGDKEPAQPECRIITIATMPATQQPVNINYDEKGRIKTIVKGVSTMNYSYNRDSIIILKTHNAAFSGRIIIVTHPNGLPRTMKHEGDVAGTLWFLETYEYNGTQLIKRITTDYINSIPTVMAYEWQNGNPVKITLLNNGASEVREYDESIPHQPGDWNHTFFLTYGYEQMRPKNVLIKKNDESYTYSFDSNGKITGYSSTGTGLTFTTTHQYQCN